MYTHTHTDTHTTPDPQLIPAVCYLEKGVRLCHSEYKMNPEERLFSSKHCLPLLLFGWHDVCLLNQSTQKAGTA